MMFWREKASERIHALNICVAKKGNYGPFRPPMKASVPLWMAIVLKRKLKCNVVPPDWMDRGV